jgi:hypothetical protein
MEAMPPLHAENISRDKETAMKPNLFAILIAALLATTGFVSAEEDSFKLSGSIGVGGLGTTEDAKDPGKLEEYRDLSNNATGAFNLQGRGTSFHFDAFGENLGRDDMRMEIKGGIYGEFNFRFYTDWLTHNFGFGPYGARTPYKNPGSNTLTLHSVIPSELANSNTPPWSSFKFSTDRRTLGGSFEYSGGSPWYLLIDGNQVKQKGINKVDAAALGTSPGNGFVDLPYPVDFTTRNGSIEGGYQSERGHISTTFLSSIFSNDNEFLNFQNPFFGFGMDTATFAPTNFYTRVSTSGMIRKLPLHATLSGRIAYDRGTDSPQMVNSVLNTSGSAALTATNPSSSTFNGKVENLTAQVSYAMEPLHGLDARLYYNYYRRRNSSTDISFNVPLNTSGLVCFEEGTTSAASVNIACSGDRYSYTKQNPGAEAGFRLTHQNRLSAGFDFLDVNRNRFDTEDTTEKKVFVQWANSSLDSLTARVKYQYLRRRSHFLTDEAGYDANSPFFLERFNRSFDVSDLNQHLVKAQVDWTPIAFLDLSSEIYYKHNDYQNLVLGRTDDHRKEIFGSISYGDPEKFRVTLFGDVEFIQYNSYHRTVNAGTCPANAPNCFDPQSAPTTTAFNYGSQLKDKNWNVELGADWPLTSRLVLKGSAMVQETRGAVDFQSQTLSTQIPAALLFPISAYDNTKRRSITPRAVYSPSQRTELTIGYSFERYEYQDDQFNGYQYTIGSGTTTSYLSGVYAFPGYETHILYGMLRVKF